MGRTGPFMGGLLNVLLGVLKARGVEGTVEGRRNMAGDIRMSLLASSPIGKEKNSTSREIVVRFQFTFDSDKVSNNKRQKAAYLQGAEL